MDDLQTLIAQREGLIARLQAVERVVIAEVGSMDQRVFQAKIIQSGLKAEWDTLIAKINQLPPPKKGVFHGRQNNPANRF